MCNKNNELVLICTLLHNSTCLRSEAAPVSLLRKCHDGKLTGPFLFVAQRGSEPLGIRLVLRLQQHEAENMHTGNTHLQSTAINSYCLMSEWSDLKKTFYKTQCSCKDRNCSASLM